MTSFAGAVPLRSLAIAALVLAGIAAPARRLARVDRVDSCRFVQTWSAGDIHLNERLVFVADGTGTWAQGGRARDRPARRASFRWTRTSSTVTVSVTQQARTVGYEIRRHDRFCYLRFDDHPIVTDHSGYNLFSPGEPY